MKKINNLFLILILLLNIFNKNIYGENLIYHIYTLYDWYQLSIKCELDSYSNDLIVELEDDLVFKDEFNSIPYFNGTFNGNNHTLSINNIDSSQINDGVFRITGKKSKIDNLNIEIDGQNNNKRFGFVGYNQGTILNINADVNINALNEFGSIAGYNSVDGYILNCKANGLINGKSFIGGIVGKNFGIIENCTNKSNINIEVKEEDFDISNITIEDIANGEKISIITDYGGICGSNFGTILNCVNSGEIGHEHLGYNVGGIAGSQSGYIKDCTNLGKVFGRKEVGGIVGQLEPSMALVYREDYLQMMSYKLKNINEETKSLLNDIKNTKNTSTDYLGDIIDDSNEIYDAIDIMIEHRDDGDQSEFNNAKTVLSSSTRDLLDTSSKLVDYYASNDDINDRISKLSDYFTDLGNTTIAFADSLTNEKEMYKDVSNKDTIYDKEGKIYQCINKNIVEGDINVGGIVGSMSLENDLDPEDDFDIIGKTSFDVTYEIKAIIDHCTNYSSIGIKHNSAGGICGNENVGNIKNSINYGFLLCDDCDYIGGIVGKAKSYLNNNYSKCFISGRDFVGGIAGSSMKGESNGSLSQIINFKSSGGSIFGNYANIENEIVERAANIKNNWYVYDDLAAIDGISYDNKAFKISYEEMFEKEIDDSLKTINVYFMDDNVVIFERSLDYGESLKEDDVPDEIIKDNQYRIWTNYDPKSLNNIKKDILFTCIYDDVYPSISSEEKPLAYIVLNGNFSSKDAIDVEIINDTPVPNANNYVTYKVTTNLSTYSKELKTSIYTNNYKKFKIYIKDNDIWKQVQFVIDGSYAIINETNINTISIVEVKDYTYIYLIAIILLIMLITIYLIRKHKKKQLR